MTAAASTHTPVEVEILSSSDCRDESCEHIDECPTFLMVVCLECNATAQGGAEVSEWEGNVAPCPIFGTGTPRDQADTLMSALTQNETVGGAR